MFYQSKIIILLGGLSWLAASSAVGQPVNELFKTIARTGPQSSGSAEAQQASDTLMTHGVEILPELLAAMDTTNIVAANWYRTVYQTIVHRELSKQKPQFPVTELRACAHNAQHQGRVRRLALALLDEIDPAFRNELLRHMLDDVEFRHDAVKLVLDAGNEAQAANQPELARQKYQQALRHARKSDQVTRAVDLLRSMGEDVRIIDQMGFVTRWYLLGPFDAPNTSGFDTVYPPETETNIDATYDGQNGQTLHWKLTETPDRMGQLNLIQLIGATKEAVGYAYTELDSPIDQTIQIRCGADDNLSVWVNGEKTFARQQWLNGTRLDRFTATANLKKGRNQVLVKICQGPQHVNPSVPNNWSMQLRFCDKTGRGIWLTTLLPSLTKSD